ncbi:MAG: OmpP1/FadL family transporter [Candidatus Syntrophosphaera sp.]
MTLLLGTSVALFAGGFALSGVGSRALGMGGAFRGMANDGTAMYWNPAGLAFMDQSEISLGGTFIQPGAKWQNTAPLPGFSMDELEAENKLTAFPYLFGTYAKNPNAVFGLGIYVPFGLGSTYDAYDMESTAFAIPDTLPNGSPLPGDVIFPTGMPENEMSSRVAIVDVHPTIGYKIMDNLSFGVGLSVLYGMIDLTQIKPTPGFSTLAPSTFEMSGTGLGFGANVGVMYKPLENLSLGFNGRFPSNIEMTGEADINLWMNSYHYFLVQLQGGSTEPQWVPVVSGGNSDIEATLKLPAELGFGLSYNLLPNWSLNLDYALTMWDRLEKINVDMQDEFDILGIPVGDQELAFNWENTNRISIGTEYRVGCNALRAGFYYDQTPIPEDYQIPTLSDTGDKMSGSFGFGRSFGNFSLDLNGQYIMVPEREVTEQTEYNMIGIYNSTIMAGNLSLAYRF